MIEYRKFITREMVRAESNKLFVFGDNLMRRGLGGQAAEMRGELNSVGIPTKRKPFMGADSFFTEDDLPEFLIAVRPTAMRLIRHEGIIIWPEDGIGTGRARLPQCSVAIYERIIALKTFLQ